MRAARELLKDLKYEVLSGSIDVNVSELVYNTRKVKKECMFVCIKGATFDSHDVGGEAAKNGAVVIVAEHPVDVPAGTAVVLVEDTRYALALISAAYFGYPAKKLKVIGITGTKGKTTTTFMIRSILKHAGISTGLIGTIEVIIGDKHIPAHNTTPAGIFRPDGGGRLQGCGYGGLISGPEASPHRRHPVRHRHLYESGSRPHRGK